MSLSLLRSTGWAAERAELLALPIRILTDDSAQVALQRCPILRAGAFDSNTPPQRGRSTAAIFTHIWSGFINEATNMIWSGFLDEATGTSSVMLGPHRVRYTGAPGGVPYFP
jgi:hypothetical protein